MLGLFGLCQRRQHVVGPSLLASWLMCIVVVSSSHVPFPLIIKDLGWPSRRKRFMGALIRKESYAWLGPEGPAEVLKHFLSLFQRRTVLEADVFCNLDDPEIAQAVRVAQGAKIGFDPDQCASTPIQDMQPTEKARARIQGYQKKLVEIGEGSAGLACDASWNPETFGRAPAWLPTLTRSTKPVWLGKDGSDYLYTASELAFSQGWPTIPTERNKFYRNMCTVDFPKLRAPEVRRLLGNGLHLHSLSAWVCYLLAHIVKRKLIMEYLPPLTLMVVEVDRSTSIAEDDAKCAQQVPTCDRARSVIA